MHKLIVNEVSYDLLPKLKELIEINIGVIKDNLNETADKEVIYDLAKELSMYAALGQYVDEEDLEEVLRILEEYPDDFGHFEIEEEQA